MCPDPQLELLSLSVAYCSRQPGLMLMQLLALAAKAGGWIRLLVVPVPVVAALRRRFIVGGADLRLTQGDAG